ncbi:hypothetical protein [Providencia hangzhouensis]|uniref:hypothetical protein n=1 Tax=Providencia hangzhouensis TaxID=3031799 RepID=UPI0034DDB692
MRFELIISYLIKFTVNCLMLLISINSYADNRPDFVCGQFNGTVIEVPDKYAFHLLNMKGIAILIQGLLKIKKDVMLILES